MPTRGLDSWLKKLTRQSMPVVGKVIAEINSLTGCDDSDVNQLAEVILRDPNLTSHVLRIANSVQYNYSRYPINTVSRAIVLLGLKGMRAVCISLLLIDTLLKSGSKEKLLQLMAQGIHAATQARDLLRQQDEESSEEVFIAALLFHLGEMAFLATEGFNRNNEELHSENFEVRREAMERLLGTSFKAITRGLAKHWRLGQTLEQSLYPPAEPDEKVRAVIIGEKMSHAALKGWDSPAALQVIEEVAAYAEVDLEQAKKLVLGSAERAAEVALHYGAQEACPLIPGVSRCVQPADAPDDTSHNVLHADAQLQLSILRELGTATAERIDVNTIFQMVLEGMHRGIGIERVTVAFIQRHFAKAKYVLGEGTENWRSNFNFDVGPYSENIFSYAIKEGGAVWLDRAFIDKHPGLWTADISRCLGQYPAFIYALKLGERTPALFYGDRAAFGGKFTQEQFDSFRHFAAQAQMNLNLLSQTAPSTGKNR